MVIVVEGQAVAIKGEINNSTFDHFEVTTLEVVKKGGRDKQWLLWMKKEYKNSSFDQSGKT